MAAIQISTLIQVSLLLTAISSCSAQDGASASGFSSGALGGIVAGVFVGATVCVCIALFGFCCWNNYQDSRMTSYNYNAPNTQSGNNQSTSASQPGEDSASHLCGCVRGGSVLQTGCCWHEEPEDSQHQSSTTMPSYYVDISPDTDANLVAPSISAVSDTNDITDLGTDVIVSADINNEVNSSSSNTPSPSSDTLIVKFTIGVTNGEADVTVSEETNVTKCEMNTPAAAPISETLIVNVDVINNEADIAPLCDVDVTNNDEDTVASGSPDN